jgi:hypothetical protein
MKHQKQTEGEIDWVESQGNGPSNLRTTDCYLESDSSELEHAECSGEARTVVLHIAEQKTWTHRRFVLGYGSTHAGGSGESEHGVRFRAERRSPEHAQCYSTCAGSACHSVTLDGGSLVDRARPVVDGSYRSSQTIDLTWRNAWNGSPIET